MSPHHAHPMEAPKHSSQSGCHPPGSAQHSAEAKPNGCAGRREAGALASASPPAGAAGRSLVCPPLIASLARKRGYLQRRLRLVVAHHLKELGHGAAFVSVRDSSADARVQEAAIAIATPVTDLFREGPL